MTGERLAELADLYDDLLRFTYVVRHTDDPLTARTSTITSFNLVALCDRHELEFLFHLALAAQISLLEEIGNLVDKEVLQLLEGQKERLYNLFLGIARLQGEGT
jgi:hypothetical protein